MQVTVKTHKRKTTNVNYLRRLWQKKSKFSYSSANNIHIHCAFYINFLTYKNKTHSKPEISFQKN